MVTLLFLAANPADSDSVRLDEECREIENRLSSVPGNRIRIISKWAVRPQDLQRALLESSPALVHFSGHGDQDGRIILENVVGYSESVPPDAFSDLFRSFSSSVRCVVLNACNSAAQACLLAQFIDCVIGMEGSVSVGTGTAFVTSFYQALAYGKDFTTAFELGRNQIRLENLGEEDVPKLYLREGGNRVLPAVTDGPSASHFSLIETFARAYLGATTAVLGLSEKLVLDPIAWEDEPPPIAERCTMRTATVRRIQDKMAGRRWYAMYGGIGTGKTHLCVLLARQHTGRCIWVRLRDRAPAQALTIIDETLCRVKPRRPGQTKTMWYQECCTVLGEDGVLVLDDVPQTSGREEIDDALVFLARAVHEAKTTLITASAFPLPPATRAAVLENVVEDQISALTEEEVLELLATYGAPPPFLTEAWARTVSAICRQHPLLLVEAIRFLEAREWAISAKAFQEVISGQYAINLDTPTQQDLVRTVPDPDTRELLYRLRLIIGSFCAEDVRGLSALPQALDHPAERLMSLLGLWVQRDGHDRYVVSPLVSRLASNLSKETEKQSHGYLAFRLVRGRPITAQAATQAIFHFASADLYENAGVLMLSSLVGFMNAKEPKDDFLLSDLWSHTSLPSQMPAGLRAGIRAGQVLIYLKKGKDASFLIGDLEQIVGDKDLPPEMEAFNVLLGGIAGLAFWSRKPAEAIRYITGSLCVLRGAPPQVLGVRSARARRMYFEMLWSALSQVKTEVDLRASLGRLGDLTAQETSQWAQGKLAGDGAETLCNSIWLAEYRKPETDRDWDKALRMLETVGVWALERSVMVLYAWSTWGTIVVLAEYLNRLDDAISIGEQAIAACAVYPKGVFWMADILGRQYYYAGRWTEALDSLGRCVESTAKVRPEKRAYAIALAGINAAKLGLNSAKGLLSQAAQICRDHPKYVSQNPPPNGRFRSLSWATSRDFSPT